MGKNKFGYGKYSLSKNSKYYYYSAHRLVAQTFIPNPNNYPEVNHKDENPINNIYYNLEWCSKSYNINYGNRNAKVSLKLSKPIIQYDLNMDKIKEWDNARKISKELGYDFRNISQCCINNINDDFLHKSHNFIWKFKEESNGK